jgi:bacterioferritin
MSHPDKHNTPHKNKTTVQQQADFTSEGAPPPAPGMMLDMAAIEAATRDLAQGAVTPNHSTGRAEVIKLLNDALATELICVLRYKRHHFTAVGLESAPVAQEFMVHAQQESEHADRLARRIVQLNGSPDFSPESLTARSHAPYDASPKLNDMIRINLMAERVAIEVYSQMIHLIGNHDVTTRRLLEDILAEELDHAEELKDWLMVG